MNLKEQDPSIGVPRFGISRFRLQYLWALWTPGTQNAEKRLNGFLPFHISGFCDSGFRDSSYNISRPFELPGPEIPKRGLTVFGLFIWNQQSWFFRDFVNRKFSIHRLQNPLLPQTSNSEMTKFKHEINASCCFSSNDRYSSRASERYKMISLNFRTDLWDPTVHRISVPFSRKFHCLFF